MQLLQGKPKRNSHQVSTVIGKMVGITLYSSVIMNVILRFTLGCAPKIEKYYTEYLERKPHQPYLVFMHVLYSGWIGIWSVGFCGGKETRKPGQKPSEQGEGQQQTHPTYTWHRARIEPRPHWSPKDSTNLTHSRVIKNDHALVWINYRSTKLVAF